MAIEKFSIILRRAARDVFIAEMTGLKSSPSNTISEAALAQSSAEAGAIETCAVFSAAASFSPSPIIRTRRPLILKVGEMLDLVFWL